MSLVLTSSGEKLEITAATTIPFTVHYANYVGATPAFTPGVVAGDTINGTKDLLVAPASGQSVVRTISVHNDSGGPDTITVQLDDAAVNYTIVSVALPDDHTLCYDEDGWKVIDASGGIATTLFAHAILGPHHSDAATDAVTRGSLVYGNAAPLWDELVVGAANEVLTNDGTDIMWSTGTINLTGAVAVTVNGNCTLNDWFDQSVKQAATPTFAGVTLPSVTFNGATGVNIITVPDNLADALHLSDAGGIEYVKIISTDAQPVIRFNDGGVDVDFEVEAVGIADALQVRGADGQITLGALTAGFVKSSAGGVLSVAAEVALTELASYTQGDLIVGGAADWTDLAIGGAHQILKVNAGATDPAWASFDWDDMAAGAGADMVHAHTTAGEGGPTLGATANPLTLTVANNGLHVLDTGNDHDLVITPGTNLTADRILTLTTGDAARTITLQGNPTLNDWFDQSVKVAASPTFADVFVPDGGIMGITGNERLIFNAAGYVNVMGAWFGINIAVPTAQSHLHVADGEGHGDFIAKIVNLDVTLGQGNGLVVQAGDAAADTSFAVKDRGGTSILRVLGDGGCIIAGDPADHFLLTLTSTTAGLVVSRMTTAQRDAMVPQSGMIIYNTTTNVFNYREAGVWVTH